MEFILASKRTKPAGTLSTSSNTFGMNWNREPDLIIGAGPNWCSCVPAAGSPSGVFLYCSVKFCFSLHICIYLISPFSPFSSLFVPFLLYFPSRSIIFPSHHPLHLSCVTSQANKRRKTKTSISQPSSSQSMQMCNFWETAPGLFLPYFPSGQIKPWQAECDKPSQSFITELSAGVQPPGRRTAGTTGSRKCCYPRGAHITMGLEPPENTLTDAGDSLHDWNERQEWL